MPRAQWTPQAETDLDEILFTIAVEDGRPLVAEKLADEIHEKAEQYARQPLMGTARPDIDEAIRIFSHTRYVVLYIPIDDGIEVQAIIDGARDFDSLFSI